LVASQISSPLAACAAGGTTGVTLYALPYLPELRRGLLQLRERRRSAGASVGAAADVTAEAIA
jgi:hypothetical protein